MLYEVITPAGGRSGRIDVRLARDGEAAVLEVRDYGRGFEDGTADGLGLTISYNFV